MIVNYPPFFQGKSYFVQFLFLMIFVIGGASIFSAFGLLFGQFLGFDSLASLRCTQFFSSLGAFFVPALLFSYCTERKFFSYNLGNRKPQCTNMLLVIVMAIFIIPIVSLLGYWNNLITMPEFMSGIEQWMKEMEEANNAIIEKLTLDPRISILFINIVVMALLPAIGEEFLFRGTIQSFCNKIFKNDHVAIWITAIIFSAIHLQFYGFVPRMLLGAYLGYLFYWSRSIWVPVVAHFLHNALSLILDFIGNSKGWNLESPFEIQGGAVLIGVSVVVVTSGIYALWKIFREKKMLRCKIF